MESAQQGLNLLSLPWEIIDKIFTYLSFDEIADKRIVCRSFDRICQDVLNRGFVAADRYHSQCLRNIKSRLPRRESERRNHALARHSDILTAVETRLSLLAMTFMKYVDMNLCCFIPGKVIDEIFRVLRYLKTSDTPAPRAHELLQELRDISSMAMEHFDEKIVPRLKQRMQNNTTALVPSSSLPFGVIPGMIQPVVRPVHVLQSFRDDVMIPHTSVTSTTTILQEVVSLKQKVADQSKTIQEQERRIEEQNRLVTDQNIRMAEYEAKMADISRKLLALERPTTSSNGASTSKPLLPGKKAAVYTKPVDLKRKLRTAKTTEETPKKRAKGELESLPKSPKKKASPTQENKSYFMRTRKSTTYGK